MKLKCKYCHSSNLYAYKKHPHIKLLCGDCYKFQKFISKSLLENFLAVHGNQALKEAQEETR